jgi:hypothetical protein
VYSVTSVARPALDLCREPGASPGHWATRSQTPLIGAEPHGDHTKGFQRGTGTPERLTIKAPALVHAIAFRPDGRQLAAGLSTLGPGPGNDVLF